MSSSRRTASPPSGSPAVYFRVLLIGYFESVDSECGIAWCVADSISLREFLGFEFRDAKKGRQLAGITSIGLDPLAWLSLRSTKER